MNIKFYLLFAFILLIAIFTFNNKIGFCEPKILDESDTTSSLEAKLPEKITNLTLQIPNIGTLKLVEGEKLQDQSLGSFDKIILEKNGTHTTLLETNGKWLIDVATGSFVSPKSYEIALVLYNGGSGGYCDVVLLSTSDGQIKEIFKEEDIKGPIVMFEDLNNDGLSELVVKYLELEDIKTNRFVFLTKYYVYNNGKVEERKFGP